jgi:hypothetical protein
MKFFLDYFAFPMIRNLAHSGLNKNLLQTNCYIRIGLIVQLIYKTNFWNYTNFVSVDEIRISICLNYENANIYKNPLCIFQCEFVTYLFKAEKLLQRL